MSSNKLSSIASKSSRHSSLKSNKSSTKVAQPRRVLHSKRITTKADGKSCSTGVIDNTKISSTSKPKKITKSDAAFGKNTDINVDYCKKCGDTVSHHQTKVTKLTSKPIELKSLPNPIQQYYKNDNYCPSSDTLTKKIPLDTIKEVSELRSSDTLFEIYPETDTDENIDKIKEFRKSNYFECHSARFRINNRGSATTLANHKCVYRFYLNNRLFPVPLSTDHNGVARCVECHLPVDSQTNSSKINGTIQAKVSIASDKTRDSTILLPVQDRLIIPQKKKQENNEETLYFGIIKLDKIGNSVFNPTLPEQSLALKYQKGFQEFEKAPEYVYDEVKKDEIVFV